MGIVSNWGIIVPFDILRIVLLGRYPCLCYAYGETVVRSESLW